MVRVVLGEPDDRLTVDAAARLLHESGANVSNVESNDPVEQFIAFAYDGEWYDGETASIQARHAALSKWKSHFRSVLATTDDHAKLMEYPSLIEEIDGQLQSVEGMLNDLSITAHTAGIELPEDEEDEPVGAVSYEGLGEDDGSAMYAAAKELQDEVETFDWERFATLGAQEWLIDQSEVMLADEELRRDVAHEYISEKTAVMSDPARRQQVIDRFLTIAAPMAPSLTPAVPTSLPSQPGVCPGCGQPNGAHDANCSMQPAAQTQPVVQMASKTAGFPICVKGCGMTLSATDALENVDGEGMAHVACPINKTAAPPDAPLPSEALDDLAGGMPEDELDDPAAEDESAEDAPEDTLPAEDPLMDGMMGGEILDVDVVSEPPTLNTALEDAATAIDSLTQVQMQLQEIVGRRRAQVALERFEARRHAARQAQELDRMDGPLPGDRKGRRRRQAEGVNEILRQERQPVTTSPEHNPITPPTFPKTRTRSEPDYPPSEADLKAEHAEGLHDGNQSVTCPDCSYDRELKSEWHQTGKVKWATRGKVAKVDRAVVERRATVALVPGQEYRVLHTGANLVTGSKDSSAGGINLDKEALAPGDVIKYVGKEAVEGSGSVQVDIFSKGSKKGAFDPNVWGVANTHYLEPAPKVANVTPGATTTMMVASGGGGSTGVGMAQGYGTSSSNATTYTWAVTDDDATAYSAGRKDGTEVAASWQKDDLVPELGDSSDPYSQGFEAGLRRGMAKRSLPIRDAWVTANRKTGRKVEMSKRDPRKGVA